MSTEVKVLGSIAAFTLVLLGGTAFLAPSKPSSSLVDSSSQANVKTVDQNVLIKSDSPQIKAENAKVTIVEFLDPECESCRAAYPTVKQILKDYEGKINFVVRYFPLHSNSVLAAKAMESAGEQGKYWEMMDILFTKQRDWGEKKEPQTELFISYAQELGLDIEKFKQGLNNKAYEDKVNRDRNDGITAGVNGTPTFFINGKLAGNVFSYDEFKSVLDPELAK